MIDTYTTKDMNMANSVSTFDLTQFKEDVKVISHRSFYVMLLNNQYTVFFSRKI